MFSPLCKIKLYRDKQKEKTFAAILFVIILVNEHIGDLFELILIDFNLF